MAAIFYPIDEENRTSAGALDHWPPRAGLYHAWETDVRLNRKASFAY